MAMVNFCDSCLRKKEEGEYVQNYILSLWMSAKLMFVNQQNTRNLDMTNFRPRD